jgi:hypothetical protein
VCREWWARTSWVCPCDLYRLYSTAGLLVVHMHQQKHIILDVLCISSSSVPSPLCWIFFGVWAPLVTRQSRGIISFESTHISA